MTGAKPKGMAPVSYWMHQVVNDAAYAAIVDSPVGKIGVCIAQARLSEIAVLPRKLRVRPAIDPLAHTVVKQLVRYFEDPSWRFDVPLALRGTPFQVRVWKALKRTQPGQLLTYGALAKQLETGPRAVGGACAANPIPIVIPCHRVVASNGLGGYKGSTGGKALAIKQWLVAHEQR